MPTDKDRRKFIVIAGTSIVASAGCGRSNDRAGPIAKIDEAISGASTDDLRYTKLALRGYQIVSMMIASRVVFLPYPGLRILSVFIMATSITATLAVEFIDDELIRRQIDETLTDAERRSIESEGHIEFKTDTGISEKVYLAPTKYLD